MDDVRKYVAIGLAVAVPVVAVQVLFSTVLSPSSRAARREAAQVAAIEAAEEAAAAAPAVEPAQPPKPQFRYKVPSDNPRFGKPFNHVNAVVGDLPLPGAKYTRSGFLVDLGTRQVLWEKNPEQSVPIASMVKMMTLLVAFETLESNPELTLESVVPVSRTASKIGGSQLWLDPKETFPLSDLLKAVAIKSANDAAYQVAEFVNGGDVAGFVGRMNARAAEIGMPGTRFINPYGLPDDAGNDSVSTALGMVMLGERFLEYPQLMQWASTPQDFIRGGKTELTNHNNLIRPRWPGVDGLKTGFTNRSGFCLTVSCLRNGRRLVGCVTGFPAAKDAATGRDPFARKLLDWGYQRAAELERAGAAASASGDGRTKVPVAPLPVSDPSRRR